jgi:hypothetical protein
VKDARHLRKDKDYRILQGLIRKTAKSFFKLWTEARTGGWRRWGRGLRRRRPGGRGARVRRGKWGGDRGEHVGLLTLDGGGQRDGWRRTGMAAGSGSHGRRRSGGSPATENGAACSARHEETSGGIGLLWEAAVAMNRWWRWRTGRRRAAWLGLVAAQGRPELGHAGARARGLNRGADGASVSGTDA